jgi:hypothetical protein|tara:strand:+ start:4401 stop:4790 length:390 start_codon:yes stop_codon:yes gene_type:complete
MILIGRYLKIMLKKKMSTATRKAKGRRLQQQFRTLLIEKLDIDPEDVESRSMGSAGEDLIMSKAARNKFPFSIEAKNQESLNVWAAWDQAKKNSGIYEPILVIKKNGVPPKVVVDADTFLDLVKEFNKK